MILQLFLTLALLAIAVIAVVGQCRKRSMWQWVAAYWVVLAVQILLDLMGAI